MECNQNRETVAAVCSTLTRRYLKYFPGYEVELCFANSEQDGVDATRIYDDCITELCHGCPRGEDLRKCEAVIAVGELKSACRANGVQRKFPRLSFSQMVQDSMAETE
jgi:hypothetical protein